MIHCGLLDGEPPAGTPLSPAELAVLSPRAVEKRRADFARGRWVAKWLIAPDDPVQRSRLSILPSDAGVPIPHGSLGPLPISLSISHTRDLAAAAWVSLPHRVGIDVERTISSGAGLVDDMFTDGEKRWVSLGGERMITLIWSAKEALAKAIGEGFRVSVKSLEVLEVEPIAGDGWGVLRMNSALVDAAKHVAAWYRFERDASLAICAISPDGEVGLEVGDVLRWGGT